MKSQLQSTRQKTIKEPYSYFKPIQSGNLQPRYLLRGYFPSASFAFTYKLGFIPRHPIFKAAAAAAMLFNYRNIHSERIFRSPICSGNFPNEKIGRTSNHFRSRWDFKLLFLLLLQFAKSFVKLCYRKNGAIRETSFLTNFTFRLTIFHKKTLWLRSNEVFTS